MNRLYLIILFVVLNNWCYSQFSEGFHLETSVTGDFIKNLEGGINTENAYIGMEDLAITLNFEEMGILKGGSLFLHGLNTHGITPSTDIVGDLQVTSNIESGNYTGMYQYYYQQQIGNSKFLIGQHDLNSEFVGTEYGGTFINSSFGISPSISLNIPVSIYPMASLAFIYTYEKPYRFIYKIGVYDGDPGNPENNRYNLQPNISLTEGLLFISEIEFFRLINCLPENIKFGAYYHTNDFTNYNDTTITQKGNYGGYFVSDKVIWSGFNHPHSYLTAFLQGGLAPSKINQVNYYIGGGLHLNGMLPNRFQDALGIACAYANMSRAFRNLDKTIDKGELSIEFTYKIHVFEHYSVQPNLQYVINPGANSKLNNALVASMRFNIFLEN
ncbi:carbohydrate porin [Carboxylicivirga linearis]|uniref:Carbohydrate porin n=1 Tax=Carboxylicivirga linearis TaxID=1628157 RepID=A0ABS5K0M2_9BACT|nr:carbohydrate porin [Carboxylicivirga linearis]MBS2100660.1 carbohydrate porin [Carboxylicivirga linearis]